ncbi:MAG: prolipoprotein diacylglyceryl transferase [Ruminococcus sp.]|jgi:phosphatidylglycerol:prolipoprotein diacylglycerol transferase|nr:prolipoprotein diacylglyceryl transferase [Ruminococcus sp.]
MKLNEIAFPALGWEFSVNPDAFVIGGFAIKWYAICIAVGVILAYIYAIPRLKKNGLDDDKAFNCVFFGFIGAIIGARAYYVLMTLGIYNWTFLSIINIRDGGLAIYGGIIGAILFAFIASRIWKVKFIPLLDVAAPSFFIGQAIGRWGNFFNQEAFGTNTTLPWGMTGGRIQDYILRHTDGTLVNTGIVVDPAIPVHPCFLYESLWCLAGFLLIHFFFSKTRTFDGELILVYAAWYGFGRAAIESLRTDSLMVGEFRVSQLLGIITGTIAVALIIVFTIRTKKNPKPLYKDTEEAAAIIAEVNAREKAAADKKAAKRAEKTREFEAELRDDEKLIDDDEIDITAPKSLENPEKKSGEISDVSSGESDENNDVNSDENSDKKE